MVMARWAPAGLVVLALFHITRGGGGFSQNWMNVAVEDLKKADCELHGTCDNNPPPQQPPQTALDELKKAQCEAFGNCGNNPPKPSALDDLKKAQCEAFGKCGNNPPQQVVVPEVPQAGLTPFKNDENDESCTTSSVTQANGEFKCPGKQIFFDDFLDKKIDNTKWNHEILMPVQPDRGFVRFDDRRENSKVRNGILFIKPTPASEDSIRQTVNLGTRCTGATGSGYGDDEECKRKGEYGLILPPVFSARLTTKRTFSFKYGRIDIRAKLPTGDWIVPEIWLEPKARIYGPRPFDSGRIQIALARGNKKLKIVKDDIGNNVLEAGVHLSNGDESEAKVHKKKLKNHFWGDTFHNYSVLWTQEDLEFFVDGESLGRIRDTSNHPLYETLGLSELVAKKWKEGTKMAPFDDEFYISLGVTVGGGLQYYFPDGCKSDGEKKPWENNKLKATANFWEKRGSWLKTWSDCDLQIDSVRVTSLSITQ